MALLCPHAFAAGGTCPTSSAYNNPNVGTTGTGTLSSFGIASCFYADFATGVDTNTGTDETHPWKHVPGMKGCANVCSTTTPTNSEGFILKGGVTWDYTNFNLWNWQWAGSGGHVIYIGYDPAWFTGASWSRPIMNLGGGVPSNGCTGNASGGPVYKGLELSSGVSFVTVDNLEFTGMCSNVASPAAGVVDYIDASRNLNQSIHLENSYFHGGNDSDDSAHNTHFVLFSTGQGDSTNEVNNNVFDNSDVCAAANPPQIGGPTCPLAAIEGTTWSFHDNYVGYFSNGYVTDWSTLIYENTFEVIVLSPSGGVDHENGIENNGGTGVMMFNNVIKHFVNAGIVDFQLAPVNAASYEFNNVLPDMDGGNMQQCYEGSPANNHCEIFNNTAEAGPDSGSPSGDCGRNTGSNTTTTITNEHCISSASGTSWWQGTATFVTNLAQSKATANAQGYSLGSTYSFQPTLVTGGTVGTGTNKTSTCTTINGLSTTAGAACLRDTTYGVSYNKTNHTITGPGRTVTNARPTSAAWDIGAFQFSGSSPQASTPTFSPVAGTYTGTQSVTISSTSSGAIICYTTNGATPVTNTTTGCATGSLYSGLVPVSVSETLKAVAGGTGFTDSSVGSAAYTIFTQASSPTFSPVAGTYIGQQSVQISTSSGSLICYNTTGAPTIVSGACGSGSTVYSTPIIVPVGSETLYAIAGGTGFTTSTVSSAAYLIHPVELWSNILDWSRGADWTQAGIPGGIPNRTSICQTVVLASGSAAAAANATALQNAINACAGTNQVVLIPSGTWYTNGFYVSGNGGAVNSNLTLRGAGPNKTILLMQSTVSCFAHADICLGGNGNGFGRYNGGATWTGDNGVAGTYTNGDTVINLGTWTGTAPSVGDLITLDQRDDSIGLCPSSGGTGSCTGNQGATESGTTVTLTTSLPHSYAVGNQVYVGGVSQPPPANGALGGQIFQSLIYPTNATCTSSVVTVTYGQAADFLPSETLTITAGAWASGVETLTVTSNPFTGHINGIRALAISGTGTTLDSNTYVLNFAGNTSTTVAFNLASAPATQPTTGTASYGGDVIWISGSNGIFSGVHTVTGTSGLTFTYAATCGGAFVAGNYILNPISYTGLWTITGVGCNVAGTYTTAASCGANPINALQYTSPVSGLISSGGGEVSVDTGGFYVSCVGGSNCASQGGSGVPGAPMRQCPFTNFGSGGTGVCATGEYSYREQREVHVITAINPPGCNTACTYTIAPPISNTNWRTSQNPGALFLGTGAYATGISVEGITVDGTNDNVGSTVDGLIVLTDCFRCWVRNVRTINGHRNHIWLPGPTAQSEVVDSYMFGSPGAAKSYGIEMSGSGDIAQNNICQHVVTCHMNAGSDSSVFAYTYTVDSGVNPPTDNIALVSWNHDNAFYDLFEGMDLNMGNFDSIHGNSDANTVLRNRIVGQDIPKKVNYLAAVQNASFNRAENYVANILGTVGQQTNYVTTTNSAPTTSYVYELPYWTVDGVLQDAVTTNTVLRWGNYDTASSAVRWCGTSSNTGWTTTCSSASEIPTSGVAFIGGNLIPTQGDTGGTIPASFYLSSQPLFWQTTWGTPHFPAIGPDIVASGGLDTTCSPVSTACDGVGHFSYQIPAQICYNNLSVDPAYQQTFTVTNATWASGTATLTIGANTLGSPTANTIVVSGVTPAGFNGTYAVSSAGATTVSYLLPTNPGSVGTTGTVAYPNILLYSGAACYPAAYPATVPAPAGVVFTKLEKPYKTTGTVTDIGNTNWSSIFSIHGDDVK